MHKVDKNLAFLPCIPAYLKPPFQMCEATTKATSRKRKKRPLTLILRKSGTFIAQFVYPGHTIYFGPFGKLRTEVFEKGSTDYVNRMCCEKCCLVAC